MTYTATINNVTLTEEQVNAAVEQIKKAKQGITNATHTGQIVGWAGTTVDHLAYRAMVLHPSVTMGENYNVTHGQVAVNVLRLNPPMSGRVFQVCQDSLRTL